MQDVSATENADVISRLVENHKVFLRFLESRVGDRALAEDILQEAFVKGLGNAASLPEGSSATAWFYRVLRNAVIDAARRRSASQRRLVEFAAELEAYEEQPETKQQVCQCVSRLVGTLKPDYAEAMQRIEVEGLSVKEFAEQSGITSGNAAVRVFRAREALRAQVVRSCGSCAEHGCLDCSCQHK